MTTIDEQVPPAARKLTVTALEDLANLQQSTVRRSMRLWESSVLFFMIALLVWGFLELTMMVYLTLLTPIHTARQPYLLIAANLLALAIGATLLLCYRRFSASHQALREELISQQAEFSRQLLEASNTDRLTGLYTLTYFWHRIEAEIGRALRYRHHFSVLIIDIKDFRLVNERFGRFHGDLVLRDFAHSVVLAERRATDLSSRYGGAQFAILLLETGEEGAKHVSERIKNRAGKEMVFPSGDGLTLAFGIASCPDDGVTREGLLRVAERRLAEAKTAGASDRSQRLDESTSA